MRFSNQTVAATALFLATKSEENIRKTKEIVIAVARVASKNPSLVIDEQSKEFWRWKDIILNYEETMLEKLTFDVVVENPHSHMYHIISELGLYDNKAIRDHSWAFIADSTFTTAGLQVSPRELAIASVFWAARIGNVKIPNGSDGSPWWIRIKGTPEKMVKAVRIVVDYFHENPLRKVKNPYGGTPKFDEADLEKTRQALPKAPTLFHPSATTNIDSPQMAPKKTPSVQSTKEQLDGSNGIDSKLDSDHAQTSKSLDHEMSMSAPQSVQGDDDKLLKEAANDLSTHERLNAEARLTQRSIKSQASSLSRKRKADDSDADMSQSEANRSKAISEASEDGELAE